MGGGYINSLNPASVTAGPGHDDVIHGLDSGLPSAKLCLPTWRW
jgi:hypothetical protein